MNQEGVLSLVLQILLISASTESQQGTPSSWQATDVIRPSLLAVKSMPYRDFRIKIYRHENNLLSGSHDNDNVSSNKSASENHQSASGSTFRYFYTPIALLDHRSAISYQNNVTGESELRFVIHLWDDLMEEAIVEYLGNFLKIPVKKEDLEVIPFERIFLELNAKLQEFLHFESRKAWVHYYVQEKYIWPRLKCPSVRDCNRMADQMRLNPTQYSESFQMKFVMEPPQKSREQLLKKDISVKASNFVSGRLFRRVESKFRRQNYVLLTPLDTRQLISESVNDIITQNFDDRTVVDDSNMYASLEQLLVSSKQNLIDGQPKNPTDGWELLYWDQDENHRPDKLAKAINQIYNLSDSNGKQKLIEAFGLITHRSQSYSDGDLSVMFEKFAFTTRAFVDKFKGEKKTELHAGNNFNTTAVAEDSAPHSNLKKKIGRKLKNQTSIEMTSQALFSHEGGFHVITDRFNQKTSDWTSKSSELVQHKTFALKMLKASENILEWTGKQFVLKSQEFSKLNFAKLRGKRTDSKAIAKISVPYLQADMVMNLKIDANFYWSPQSDMQTRLQDTLRGVEKKFQQLESKMASDQISVLNTRDKLLHDYKTHHEALAENTSKQVRQLHRWIAQELSNLRNWTDGQFSEQIWIRNTLIDSLERKLLHTFQLSNQAYDEMLRQLQEQMNRGTKLDRMPSSCRDLWTIGHSHTGYYIVKSNDSKHPIQIIYCEMADRGNASSSSAKHQDYSRADASEKWIGYSDVKTTPVYFHAQRLTTFSQQGTAIPFQAEILNAGGAFSLPEGTFRAPTPGIYHFSFSGLRAAAHHFVHVTLQVNGKRVGSAYSGTPESNKIPYRPTSLSLQSTLELKRGDQVRLFLEAGAIGAEIPCQDCVHFSGMLLTEYL